MSMFSKALKTSVILGVALVLPPLADAQAQKVLKFGHVYEVSHPEHVAALEAAEELASCTGGEVTMEVFPASQLGKETSLNEQIQFGGVDIILTGQLFAAGAYPPIALGGAPYIFRNRDHALAYRTSDVFKELWAGWDKATGQHIMAAGYFGAFNVTSNDPIITPEDMKGMKVRVPDAPPYMAFPRAVGANPTPVAFAEVYLALQQGVVTASVNPLPVTFSKKFYEVQEYVALTNHLVEYVLWVVGDHVMKALTEPQVRCLQQAADSFAEKSTQALVDQEDSLREKMTKEGMIRFTEPDIAAFRAATRDALREYARDFKVPDGFLERVDAL